jgi:hypothetical protein
VNGTLDPLARDPLVRITELPGHAVQKDLGAHGGARDVLGLRGGEDAPQTFRGIGGGSLNCRR